MYTNQNSKSNYKCSRQITMNKGRKGEKVSGLSQYRKIQRPIEFAPRMSSFEKTDSYLLVYYQAQLKQLSD